ncbi:MAG: hypothetical protein ACJ8AW_25345 [Rhodopila sp.]
MPVTVTRIYDSPEKAKKAADELKKFTSESQIHVVNPSGQNVASLEVALTATGMSAGSAKAYGEAVGRGRSVVTVAPSFGSAARTTEVLDAAGPVDTHITDVPDTADRRPRRAAASGGATVADPAAPLSSKFGWEVLATDNPTPLSDKAGWKVLSPNNPTPLSDKLGWKTLSDSQDAKASLVHDPAPLSSKFGWAVLSRDATPVSNKFGWRVLSDDPAPLSRKLGWRVLSEDRTSRISLINDPAPLSRWLGLPVLLNESKRA